MKVDEYRNSALNSISDVSNKPEDQNKNKYELENNERHVNNVKGEITKTPKIYLGNTLTRNPSQVDPFYTTLLINNKLVKKCMIDSRAEINIMPMAVMKELGLWVDATYGNCYVMDNRLVLVIGVIWNVELNLVSYPKATYKTDINVVDIPPYYGMLLSRQWTVVVGGMLNWIYHMQLYILMGKKLSCTKSHSLNK